MRISTNCATLNRTLQDETSRLEKLEEEWLEAADGLEQVEKQLGAMGRLN